MILFTSGFPYAGKTLFLDILLDTFNTEGEEEEEGEIKDELDIVRICPKEYYPDNFDTLHDNDKSTFAISAWEVSLEETEKAIEEHENKTLIVLDTAAAKVKKMRPLFSIAKKRGHSVIYVFINSSLEDRQNRTNDDVERFEEYYANSFKITVPHLKSLSDTFMLIKNPNDPEYTNLNKSAKNLKKIIEEIKF